MLFELDHDMQSAMGQFVFWLVISAIAMASVKYEKHQNRYTRRIAVGECLKPKATVKFHSGDIVRGGEYVE